MISLLDWIGLLQRYSEGSQLSGLMYRDKVFLDFPEVGQNSEKKYSISYVFGCHQIERGKLFNQQLADGILGMANRKQSYIAVLNKKNELEGGQFAMCLDFKGGSLALGGANVALHTGIVKWTPMQSSSSYSVKVSSVKVNGKNILSGSISGIVDSGTTFTMIPRQNFNTLKATIEKYCQESGHCHSEGTAGNFFLLSAFL